MALREGSEEQNSAELPNAPYPLLPEKDRPSLVEMTREQYEGLLRRALRRLRETDS